MSHIDHYKRVEAPIHWLDENGFDYDESPIVVGNRAEGLIIRVNLPYDRNDNLIFPIKLHKSSPRRTSPRRTSPKRTSPRRTSPRRTSPRRTSPTPKKKNPTPRRSSKKGLRQRFNNLMSSLSSRK